MPFSKLSSNENAKSFWIGSVLVEIRWAETWVFADQTEDNMERTTRYFSIHKIEKEFESENYKPKAFCLIAGPLKIIVGW
jgi:hypothetical protein